MRSAFRFRLRILLGLLGIMALVIITKLYMVQIIQGDNYSVLADRQYISGANSLYDRGTIYFTRKDGTLISAATIETGYLVAINPEILRDAQKTYEAINAVVPIDSATFFAAAAKTTDPYEKIAQHISLSDGQALSAKKIHGVMVIHERWRSYPGGTLAAHTIGFVAYNNGTTLGGRYGLERYYNRTLTRTDSTYHNFFAQIFSNISNVFINNQADMEGDIVTTIEPDVESRLMADLVKVQKRYHSKETGGIIMDPATGAIIAMGSVPTFDPNNFEVASTSVFANSLVEHVHEYGSIMKPLTMASALDAGLVTPQTTYNDTGCIHVDGGRICNWDYKARGVIPMAQIIVQSLNVGASWLAEQLGQEKFRTYFVKMFGQKTGVDLPSETNALLSNIYTTHQIDYDTASFGQGIAETPMQMIRALGALANGGVMVQPHLVSAIRYQSGKVKKLDWSKKVPIFSATAVHETAKMMTELTDVELDHGKAKIPTMAVAVKTGTAQLTKPTGGYYMNRFFHSFTGFFPSYSPRFIILIYTDDPKGAEYSAQTLAAPFLDLTHFLINYYQIPPDRNLTPTS